MGKLKKSLLISLAALFVAAIAVFGILHMNFAHAAEVSVTVQSDGNGNVSAKDQSGAQITISAEQGSSVEITASPTEGYVFAYWYIEENTPLSYDEVYSYSIPAATTTLHAKFFKNEDKMTVTASEDYWDTKTEGTYQIKSGTEYNFSPQQDIPIYFEFVGEKWFNFDYNLSVKTDGYYYGYIYVFVDGLQYISQSFSTGAVTSTSNCLKTIESKYHRVEIRYQTPNDERAGHTSSQVPTALEFTLSNISLKEESAFETTQATVTWDKRLGDAYILPGVVKATGDTNDEFIIAHGKQLQNEDGSATVSVPVGVPIAFAIKPFEQVDSTIVPEQKTGVHYGGVNYGPLTYSKAISLKFDAEGKVSASENNNYYDTNVSFDLKEIAFAPKVSITKVIDSVYQQEETISDNGRIELPYGKANNLLVTIQHYETVTNTFSVTSQGQDVSCENLMGKTGFSLNDITENKTIVITYKYEDKYYVEGPFTFNIYIKLESGNDGLDSIISPVSSEITVTNDEQFPWYFDPAGNGEGSFAFSSGISYQPNSTLAVPAFSQLGFTVKGNGSFTFEFHIDGYALAAAATDDTKAKYSYAAYRIGSPIPTSTAYTSGWLANNEKYTNADWGVKGFKASIATNLGWGLSTSASNLVAPKIFNAETVDAKNYWYKVTIQVQDKRDDEETVFYIAHAIGNKTNSSFACMSVRNVAFFSGDAYVDWDVQNSVGTSGEKSDITVKQGASAVESGIIAAGTSVTFEANPQGGRTFYGWKAVTGTLKPESMEKAETPEQIEDSDIQWDLGNAHFISYDLKYNYIVGVGYVKIVAVIDTAGTYAVRHENKFYSGDDIETAFAAAKSSKDKNVYVVDNVTLNSIEVPADVNLVIPYDRAGSYYAMGTATTAQTRVSWASTGDYKDPVYTLTLSGENTLNGNLYVGGVLHYPDQSAQGHTSGAYSQLILNGNLSVESGGHFDVYGRVTGDGAIDVKSGGKLSQPFMITDYNGGTNTEASFNAGVTPFKMYAMVNVQNKGGFTIHHGAELWGHASLYFWESITTIDTPFISYVERHEGGKDYFKNAALIILNDGAQAHIVYDDKNYDTTENGQHKRVEMKAGDNTQDVGFTKIEITGNAYAGYMQFPLGINTTQVYFSVPYNYDITLKSGQFDILYPYKLMPGASFTVEQQATLVVRSEAGLQVYDSFYGPEVEKRAYPTGAQLIAAGYKPYANFVVNGTLDIKDNAHFVGTVQNNGTGTIKIGAGVTLKEDDLFDGVATEYSCNYTKYSLVAHVWDSAHGDGEMRMLEANKTYTAVSGDITFTLPGIEFSYENGDTKHNSSSHTLAELTTAEAHGLKGAWALTEHEHVYEWDYSDEEHPTDSEKIKTLTRQCTELGCKEHKTHKLLYTVADLNLGDITFKNSAITEDDIKELLKAYYGADVESLIQSIQIDGEKINHGQNYSVTVTLNEDSFFWADGAAKDSFVFKWNIKEAEITEITLSSAEKPYDGEAITKEIVTKVVAGELQLTKDEDYDVNITLKDGGENSANVGVYTVTVTGKNNYKGTISKDFTIKVVEITIDVKDDLTATYAGSKNAPEIPAEAYVQTGKTVGNDSITVTVKYKNDANEWKAGGSFALTAEAVIKNGNAQNYKITVNDGSLTVNKKPVTLKVKDKNATYSDGSAYDVVWELEGAEDFGDDFDSAAILALLTITCDVNENNEAGKHTINVKWTSDDQTFENFEVTLTPTAEYTITPAEYGELHFGGDETVVYDGTPHERTLTLDDETVTVKIYYKLHGAGDEEYKEQKPINAGTYDVKAELQSENYNNGGVYTFTTGGTLTIDKASISEVTITGEYEYDGKEKTLQVTVKTANGLTLTANDYTVQCSNFKNAEDDISYSVTAKTDNYTGTASTTFTIAKKAATVKINNQSKVYDMTAPNLSQTEVTIEGLVDGEDIGLQLSLDTSVADVSDYRIEYGVTKATVANNYNITYCTSDGKPIDDNNYPKYSITPQQATITVGNLTSVYGEEVKTNYEYTSEGFLSDGYTPLLSYECSVVKGTAKGDYDITATVTNEHKNYDITVNKGKYEVTARAITITVNSGTSVYGGVIPAELAGYEITQGEKYGDDNLQVTLKRDAGTDAGIYNVTAECGNTNYSATIVQGKWTITKKPVSGIMVIVSDGTNDYSDSGDGVIHAKFGGQPLTISAGAPNPYQDLHVETSVTKITETGSYTVTARIVETNYSGEITVKIEVAPDLSIALERLAALKAQLSGEELTAEDFGVMKQINDLINGLAEEDRESDELNEYKELIESWNAAAGIDEEIITQANSLADEIISGIIAAISAAAAIAYVAIFGGKAI